MPTTERSSELNSNEEQKVEEQSRPRAVVIHEVVLKSGNEELRRPTSGLAAGLSMGFSFATIALLRAHLPDAPWRPLVSELGYTVGFLIVVLGRQQLFTENTLSVVLPLLHDPRVEKFRNVLRLWTTVLAANLVGALLFALAVAHLAVFPPEVRRALGEVAREAMHGGFWEIGVRAVFAGWLIALMVWLLAAVEGPGVSIIVLLSYLVGIGGFAHVIAGSVEVLYAVVTGDASRGAYLGGYLVPTLFGNILGGVALVTALNHAQVVAGEEE